ncbi:hypothetical protein PDK45_25120 [Bacillus cereus]|nr:hypothetical protein [Bacillus cereus]
MNEQISVFRSVLQRELEREVSMDEISYETIKFYKDEIDEAMIPNEVLATLGDKVTASSILFVDAEGNEYMRIAVQDEGTFVHDKYVRWFINYKPVDWKV